MVKYKQYFEDMLKQNKELFDKFQTVHDLYTQNPKQYQKELNVVGSDVLDIIRRSENRLCSQSEGSGYGKFSTNLADKFQSEVRAKFPKITAIGITE